MADAVYQALDRMVPALEDLQIRGIFNKDEIKAIVQKRRDFEFLLRRRTARKADFLRYIEYEMNLEELRRLRKDRIGLLKSTISDHSGKQLIHFIFERALRKFRGDLELWLQYLDYCAKTKSNKHHSRGLAAALQIFPRQAGLWIRAASYEFFDNANPTSARVLLQRGLRINRTSSRLLWLQYYKLELLYIEKLRGRREALGLEDEKQGTGKRKRSGSAGSDDGEGGEAPEEGGGVDVPHLDEERDAADAPTGEDHTRALAKQSSSAEADPHGASVAAFFRGAVPRVVFESARKAIPGDLDFCLQFLDIARDFPLTTEGEGGLVEAIVESIEKEMGPEEATWARAVHELKKDREGEDEGQEGAAAKKGKKRKTADKGKPGAKALPTRKWLEQSGAEGGVRGCLAALEAGVDKDPQSAKMFSYYLRGLTELLEGIVPDKVVVECLGLGHQRKVLETRWYGDWADLVGSGAEARAALEKGLARGGEGSRELYRRLLAVKVALGEKGGLDDVLEKALDGLSREESADVWLQYVQGGAKGAWERAVVSTSGAARVMVCEAWWEKEGAKAFDAMIKLGGVLTSQGLGPLCKVAIDAEEAQGAGIARLRAMYEAALAVCASHTPLWEAYEEMERKTGDHKKANAIRWRREQRSKA